MNQGTVVFLVFLPLTLTSRPYDISSNEISSFNDPDFSDIRNAQTLCRTFPGMNRKQMQLCRRMPDVTAAAIQGIDMAVHECQHQMKNRRWNCSSLEMRHGNPFAHALMSKAGLKETAFAHSLVSAGVLYQVTRSCSAGKLPYCGCDTRFVGSGEGFEWGGCSHDIKFGEGFAIDFLDSSEKSGRDAQARMNLHNKRAGRLAVSHYAEKRCKCHGMSGSCQLKTCWMQTPHFREVGSRLMEKFADALEIRARNTNSGSVELVTRARSQVSSHRKRRRFPPQEELVFLEKSPDFCVANPRLGSPGTRERYCNRTSTGIDGCDSLCCGRGYNIRLERRTEWCNCTFHWCCYVRCQQCHSSQWVNQCK
ncbi:protein Wnt-10b-like isoform X1 [Lytechinus variegatus]|uniref:protein Wnt-10b-like isoform X1 n=1 Tax=Lytechinus variegatus TaxID=7654 RepID=UPI001BB2758B|nr:protein Wnt-10b-like isoform X1 [Lytechinus variegatus]